MERKLAVILVADIVGYSAQMERDEAGTYARVTARRLEVFEPEITRHKGRIFKLVGDGLLAEFGSVVQAVECAMSIQTALEERNLAVPGGEAILARIGINLGEVIVDGDDRYGEGVNIAARLEQLAEPGGICVSDKVAREVERKLAFGFEPMGAQKVKNIAEPIQVYRVTASDAGIKAPAARGTARLAKLAMFAAVLVIAVIAIVALIAWSQKPVQELPPTVAVLPLVNKTGDPSLEFLAVGLSDDIAKALSTSPEIAGVERWNDKQGSGRKSVKEMPQDTTPGYLVEGEFMLLNESGRNVRIRLIDTVDQEVIWSEDLPFEFHDLAVQRDRFSRRAYARLLGRKGEILRREMERGQQGPATGTSEYGYHLRALVLAGAGYDASSAEIMPLLLEGLERYPESARLRLDLAAAHFAKARRGPLDVARKSVDSAWYLVEEAAQVPLRTSDEDAMLAYMRAVLLPLVSGSFFDSVREAEKAQAAMPYNSDVLSDLAYVMANAAYVAKALEWSEKAVVAEQSAPDWYRAHLAWALYLSGRSEAALLELGSMSEVNAMQKAATLSRASRMSDAKDLVAATLKTDPAFAIAGSPDLGVGGRHPLAEPGVLFQFRSDLSKAGVKMFDPKPPSPEKSPVKTKKVPVKTKRKTTAPPPFP